MKRLLSIFFTVIFSFASVLLFSQNKDTKKDPAGWKKAEKLYQQKGYMASAAKYQMKHSQEDMTPDVMARIANSYRLNGDAELAEYWFAMCINKVSDTEDIFHYAEVLQSNGKCEDAVRWFDEYKSKSSIEREFISDCSELNSFDKRENVEVENLKALNTKYLDYCAMNHDEGVVFTSTRGIKKMKRFTDSWTKSNFSDVFFAKKNGEEGFESPVSLGTEINKKYHDGVTSISESGTILYFSRNNKGQKNKSKVIDLKIYQSIFVDGRWKDANPLPFNGDDFASCHPSISSDGKWLYFASNRPGGFGGMDIYVVENVDGKWKEPINLGPTVNTSGNEVFPFVNNNGSLFFASNGHKGMGGLDVFYAEKGSLFDETTWNMRKNIGAPFNTKRDDFGFYSNARMTQGYLTSNRVGGKGGDDIYTWKTTDGKGLEMNPALPTEIQVMDNESNDELRNAIVTIKDVFSSGKPFQGKTNTNGTVTMNMDPSKTYKIKIEKEGYMMQEKEVAGSELIGGSAFNVEMEKIKCIDLSGMVLNEKYNKSIPNATVTLINKCTGEKTVVNSQKDGSFDFCLDVGCDFDLIATKSNFMETETVISTMADPIDWSDKEIKVEMLPMKRPIKSTPVTEVETKEEVAKHFLGNETATFRVGQVLTLKNIYYDFNQSNIRPDAKVELDYIVVMMNQFPTMEITLSSHTDSRGDKKYNKALSEKRAKSAREYIISKGIASHRIIASGFGESVLKNDCIDGVNCPDDKHQINRRTEVLINKMN